MEKVNKPKGLIRYDTNKGINGQKSKLLRNRTIIYLLLLAVIIAGFTFLISKKEDYLITILRAKDQPYSSIINEEGTKEIINHFKIHLKNQTA
ncbi:MAG: cytochrome c oxidase accessory protein CcoG, partial [Candidatus Dadabacteria bacterium]|nr:cytochrome c oxidase accessory protein CcoG [Candidatus Dadabacteria bacterium]NIQ14881.1 cytochrome c oxidase accessory protein CcoG [Candidatus Dadabacteria bacterium]